MKKLLSFFLAVILVSALCTAAMADTISPEFTVSTAQCAPGGTIKVTISATNVDDVATFMLNIVYDSAKLTVNKVTTTGLISGNGVLRSNMSTANGKLSLVWENGRALSGNGNLFNVEFKVGAGLSSGKLDLGINSTGGYVRDANGLDMSANFIAGAINVVSTTPEITFGMPDVSAKNGEEVIVLVSITKNPGISKFMFNLEYDKNILSPKLVEAGTILAGTAAPRSNITQADGKLVISWEDDANLTPIGEILKITFSVSEAIKSQTTTIKMSKDSDSYFKNAAGKDINPFFDNADIEIESDYSSVMLILQKIVDFFSKNGDIFTKMTEMFVKVIETIMTVLVTK